MVVVFMLWWVCFFNYADRQAIYAVSRSFSRNLIYQAPAWVDRLRLHVGLRCRGSGGRTDRRSFPRKTSSSALPVLERNHCDDGLVLEVHQFVVVRAAEGSVKPFYFPASMS